MRHASKPQFQLLPLFVGVMLIAACSRPNATATPSAAVATSGVPIAVAAAGDVQRGDYLATVFACKDCHSLREADGITLILTMTLAGGQAFSGPWGTIHSANVTEIAPNMPAADLGKLIRGQLSPLVVMPTGSYNKMSEQDMADLIAYLHTLKPVTVANPPPDDASPNFKPPPLNLPVPISATAPAGITAERGNYLTTMAGCDDCHTPKDAQGAFDLTRRFSGVENFAQDVKGNALHTPNLTPDKATGLGNWTDEQIITAFRIGIAEDGHQLNPLMPYASAYHAYTDDDAAAVVAYLRSLPAVSHAMPDNPVYKAP